MNRAIYIVDDDDAVRTSLQTLLSVQPDLSVRCFASGDAFLALADTLAPGVLLLDFQMPGASGLDVLDALAGRSGHFAPLILSGQGNVKVAVKAMKGGAVDFLEKPYETEQLLMALERSFARLAADGEAVARVRTAEAKIARLSPREADVLRGLVEGRSNKVIAFDLDISPRRVEIYRANLMEKLEVRSLSEALRIAFASGTFPV